MLQTQTMPVRNSCRLLLLLLVMLISCMAPVCAQKQIGASEELTKKAKDHLNLFQYEQALKLLKQAMDLEPDNWEPWFLAGRAFIKMKKEAEAEKFLVKALKLNPGELEVQKTLGALYILNAKAAQAKGQTNEMADSLLKACQAYPGGTKIWQSLLEHWWKTGEYEKIKKEGDLIVKANAQALAEADDQNLQTSLVIVAKAFYRDGDFAMTKTYLDHAGKIRAHNEDMYALKRELNNKAEESVKRLVDEAKTSSEKGDYAKALELLQNAGKMPGAKSSEILELMDKIEKEASLKKSIKDIDALIEAKKYEEALEKLHDSSQEFPENKDLAERLKSVSDIVDKIRAEEAKASAAVIAEKKRKMELARQLQLFIKEGEDNEQKKNFDMAAMSYEKALGLAPDNKDLPARIAEMKQKAAKARERQNAFSIKFNEFDNLFSAANYEECYNQGKELLSEFPEHSKAISAIFAETCLKTGKYTEAREAIIALEGDSEHETLHDYIIGMVSYQEGDRDKALEYLTRVKNRNSSFRADISSTIYWIYLYKVQFGIYILLLGLAFPAIKMGKEALANWKATSMINKLEKIKESGDYEANLAFLEERFAREDTPNPKQVQVMLAEALLRTGNPQRAYEMANSLLKKDARNPLAKRIAGEAALIIEDSSPTGLEHVQALLKIDEARKDVISYLARVYIKQQADHKMAQDFILKAISINPADVESVVYLADVFIKRQTYSQQSLKIFERAIKAAPEVPEYYMAIIENYHRLDNPQEAQKWRETAASRFPAQSEFMEDRPRAATGQARSGLRLKTDNEPAVKPASPGAFPDYDSIGNDGSQPSSTPAGGFPDYESIGNDTYPTQTPASGAFPDYESIGNEPGLPAAPAGGGFPDYDSIGDDSENLLPPLKPVAPAPPAAKPAPPSGPQKNCPHCNAVNSLKDYYCNTCGKPC